MSSNMSEPSSRNWRGFAALCRAMEVNQTVTKLTCDRIAIGDSCAQQIESMVKNNKGIRVLSMQECQLGMGTMSALLESLSTNSTVTRLNISWNNINITELHADDLHALQHNVSLVYLDLQEDKRHHQPMRSNGLMATVDAMNRERNRRGNNILQVVC